MQQTYVGEDTLRRFTAMPLSENFRVMNRTIRLQTNDLNFLGEARQVFACQRGTASVSPDFAWRVVVDPSSGLKPPWPKRVAFSDDSLRYVNLGCRSFIAVDLAARESVGFLSEELAGDPSGIRCPFFSDLFDLSAPALGLTEIAAASVARASRCLLIFGPPQSGKTTSAFRAMKLGLQFHADQEVFLESQAGRLLAWGDMWPAIFRLDILDVLPELEAFARPFHYQDLSFLCVEKNRPHPDATHPAIPHSCIFLERDTSEVPTLTRLEFWQLKERLAPSFPFKDDPSFEARRAAVLTELASLPGYRLAYGPDPYAAACVYRDLLGGD